MMFVSSKSNTMGGNGAGTTYPTTVPEFTPRLGLCCSIFSFLCRDLSTIVCLFVGLHSVYIWFTFGLHLVYIWFTFGLHLVYIWSTFGLHLVYIQSTFGLHLVYIWFIFGLHLAIVLSVLQFTASNCPFCYLQTFLDINLLSLILIEMHLS